MNEFNTVALMRFFFDTFSPAILNPVMKVVYFLFGWAIKRFK